MPTLFSIPIEFYLFGLTLICVAVLHRYPLEVALTGLLAITLYKLGVTGFATGPGFGGLAAHLAHEWVTIANLFCLLLGFELLSRHFEKSRVPLLLPRILPGGWAGGFMLLVIVFVLSGFLDNIAATLIGGAMAHQLFRAKVHVGYLAAIVAAANAGGAGSVIGDTTTTMMWISGISPMKVLDAYVGAATSLVIVAFVAARQQHAYSPILRGTHVHVRPDWARIAIVGATLLAGVATNVVVNMSFTAQADSFPFLGVAIFAVLLASALFRRPDWEVLPGTAKGALFLIALVLSASMMPVQSLPAPSLVSVIGLGAVSAVFDNIPLTALAIRQGGYDWGYLAYAVGFGGSMIWFGSSAGVAISNMFGEAKSVFTWLRAGWHVPLAYVCGNVAMALVLPWQPG